MARWLTVGFHRCHSESPSDSKQQLFVFFCFDSGDKKTVRCVEILLPCSSTSESVGVDMQEFLYFQLPCSIHGGGRLDVRHWSMTPFSSRSDPWQTTGRGSLVAFLSTIHPHHHDKAAAERGDSEQAA